MRRFWRPRELAVFHDLAYRLPLAGVKVDTGFEPRRADFAVAFLTGRRVIPPQAIHRPPVSSYEELALVHTEPYLESLSRPETLAQIFSVDPPEVRVDELLHTLRLACGGTAKGARLALERRIPVLNTFGGFHHAAPARGAGFCAINDIAVAIALVRQDGFSGPIAILDLDAHPPDGLAECLKADPRCWLGSLSGSDWGPLPKVDETVLPQGCDDRAYLQALDALLSRMPKAELAFVIAGGDVLAGDKLGLLGLTLTGARARDLRVHKALRETPSVWVPGGGYQADAWRVLAGTGAVLAGRSRTRISESYDPLRGYFESIVRTMGRQFVQDQLLLDPEDLDESLHQRPHEHPKLLGVYSEEAIEYALSRFGLLSHLRRLGYQDLRIEVGDSNGADRFRLLGKSEGVEHLLMETVLEKQTIGTGTFLFSNWFTLRHPRAQFSAHRPQLPGQDVPGLGLAREAGEVLAIIARQLNLDGLVFRPSWYHMAYAARYRFRFINSQRQGRFEAMLRDFKDIPLRDVTLALGEGRVLLNDQTYRWEPDDMAYWLTQPPDDADAVAAERERDHFRLGAS